MDHVTGLVEHFSRINIEQLVPIRGRTVAPREQTAEQSLQVQEMLKPVHRSEQHEQAMSGDAPVTLPVNGLIPLRWRGTRKRGRVGSDKLRPVRHKLLINCREAQQCLAAAAQVHSSRVEARHQNQVQL